MQESNPPLPTPQTPPQQPPTPAPMQTPNSQPSPPTTPPPTNSNPPKTTFSLSKYLIAALMLLIGIGLGFILFKEFPQEKMTPTTPQNQSTAPVTLPKDAVQIQTCADHKGSLFVKPENIPQGPIYMVYKGKVIGTEFMLDLAQTISNKNYGILAAQDVHVNHVKLGYLSQGHQGNPKPHFHVDLYTVSEKDEESITCPKGDTQMNMPGMNPSNFPSMIPNTKQIPPATSPMVTNQMQMPSTIPTQIK